MNPDHFGGFLTLQYCQNLIQLILPEAKFGCFCSIHVGMDGQISFVDCGTGTNSEKEAD